LWPASFVVIRAFAEPDHWGAGHSTQLDVGVSDTPRLRRLRLSDGRGFDPWKKSTMLRG
jgi:hypothetical protein